MTTIHLVPHTHWDREWYLPFQSFRLKLVHLMDLLLDILETDPEFSHFTLDGQTILLEDYLHVRPEREADLTRHVRSGRLEIGPWYILPDEFLVSPEALIRNLLQGSRVCRIFGSRMHVGYIPDPFGHIGQMPQILRGFGLEIASLERGLADEPCELWWEAPDGSRVLLLNLRDGYDNAARLPTLPRAFVEFVRQKRDSLAPHMATSHCLLLNGTDHHEPQPELAARVRSVSLEGDGIVIDSLGRYAATVAEEIQTRGLTLPVIRGELRSPKRHHLLSGVLSSRTWIKQRNHACETLLERWVEPSMAWAELLCGDVADRSVWTGHLVGPRLRNPRPLLDEAWKLLLQCQPHDSICGCSVDPVHEEMRLRFDQVEQIGEELTRQSLMALAEEVDTSLFCGFGARSSLVVFNSEGQIRSESTLCRIEIPAGLDPFEIVGPSGQVVPYRLLGRSSGSLAEIEYDRNSFVGMLSSVSEGRVMGLSIQEVGLVRRSDHVLVDVVLSESADPNPQVLSAAVAEIEAILADEAVSRFQVQARFPTNVDVELLAPDCPEYGYVSLGLRPASQDPEDAEWAPNAQIENEAMEVEAAPDGTLTLRLPRQGITYSGLMRFEDVGDRGDSYNFCPVEEGAARLGPATPAAVRSIAHPCGQSLEVSQILRLPEGLEANRLARSTSVVEVPVRFVATLTSGLPRLDITVDVDNRVRDHRLRVMFPCGSTVDAGDFDGHFQIVPRSARVPQGTQDWIEQPAPETPMRAFVAAGREGCGLMVASRGLREASVSPDGVIAVTLLRCFGWLSRDDLATRQGGAGPMLPTPGGQSLGSHVFHLCVIPFIDLRQAALMAYSFQSPLRALSTSIHKGKLPARASFLCADPESFYLTAIKPAESRTGIVVRGVNLGPEAADVHIRSLLALRAAELCRLDETPLRSAPLLGRNEIAIRVRGHETATIWMELEKA